jgi:tetratricopeptide (TPR) repeat protein
MRDCVLLLDDLHWAGSDALDLLAVIAHAASQSPLRIVAAYRDTDVDRRHPLTSWLADLAHAELVRPLRLGPLAVPAAADLLQQSLGAEGHVPETIRDDLLRRSGGVPFYLVSYAQTVRDHAPETGDVPWSVAQSVRQRVAMLPEGAERTLAALAVAGPADPDLLAHVAGVDPLQAVDVLDTAERGRLVNAIDNQYTFSHDLIREVVEAETTAARRSFLNRRAAEYLEDATGSDRVERLARHYVRGGLNERAIPYLDEAAGRARRRYALSAAAGYLRELVDILVNLGREEEAARAGERLGEVLTIVGRYDEALSVLIGAERRYRDHGVQEGIWRTVALIGRAHAARGSAEEGIGYLQPVLSTRGAQPSGGLARLFTSLARLHFIRGEYPEQLVAGEEAIRHARGVSDDVLLVDAMNVTSVALGMIGRIEESLTAYDEVIRLGTEVGLLEAVRAALGNAAATYLERGQFARGRPYVERALAVAEQIGDPTQVAFLRAMRGELALYSGDRQAARTDLESARDALRHGPRNALAGQTLVNLARLHLEDGVNPTAIGYLKESLLTEELQTQREAQSLLAEIDLKEGRPADAIERLRPLLGREGSEEWDAIPLLALVAEAYLAGGNVDDARVLAAIAVRRARDQGFGLALVDALRVTALIQEASGDVPGALGSLDEAIALTRDMPYPQGEKRLRLQRGRIARVRDDRQ